MSFERARYYLAMCCLVVGVAGFYTVIIVGGLGRLLGLEGLIFWIVFWFFYLCALVFGWMYYVPRLRNVWRGEMIENKHYNLRSALAGITVSAMVLAGIAAQVLDLYEVPGYVVFFTFFIGFFFMFAMIAFYRQ